MRGVREGENRVRLALRARSAVQWAQPTQPGVVQLEYRQATRAKPGCVRSDRWDNWLLYLARPHATEKCRWP